MTRRAGRPRPSSWTTEHVVEEQELSVGKALWLIEGALAINWVFDPCADCDADGNRGRPMTFEDERIWTLTSAALCGLGGEWSDPLVGAAIPAAVVAAAETWAETYEPPDYGETPEEYEQDYDVMNDDRAERRLQHGNDRW